MQVQSAAASLAAGNFDFAAVLLQHPHGGLVQPRERDVGDAPGKKRDAVPAAPLGGKRPADLAEEEGWVRGRGDLFQLSQAAQQLEEAHGAHQPLHAAGLVQVEQRPHCRHGGARFKQMTEDEAAPQSRQPPWPGVRFDLRARVLYHAAVRHTRGTGRFAPAAGQAQVDVPYVGWRDGRALGHLYHLVDAAARRIHLQPQLAVRRAGVQAKPAVDAAVQIELPRPYTGSLRYGDTVGHGLRGWRGQIGS